MTSGNKNAGMKRLIRRVGTQTYLNASGEWTNIDQAFNFPTAESVFAAASRQNLKSVEFIIQFGENPKDNVIVPIR